MYMHAKFKSEQQTFLINGIRQLSTMYGMTTGCVDHMGMTKFASYSRPAITRLRRGNIWKGIMRIVTRGTDQSDVDVTLDRLVVNVVTEDRRSVQQKLDHGLEWGVDAATCARNWNRYDMVTLTESVVGLRTEEMMLARVDTHENRVQFTKDIIDDAFGASQFIVNTLISCVHALLFGESYIVVDDDQDDESAIDAILYGDE